jgi:ABC-type sugar transport system ATPase subunit
MKTFPSTKSDATTNVRDGRVRKVVAEAISLSKHFGQIRALQSASFTLSEGEVLAVVGANGAGKSTLLKILAGVYPPDGGTLRLNGEDVTSFSAPESRGRGIEMVYQDLADVPNMDAVYNLFVGRPIRKWGIFADHKSMIAKTREVLTGLGVATVQDVTQPVETMSGGQRQALAIARAVTWGSRIIILDEPTAALGILETERVLRLIGDVKGKGASILLVTHNLEHVFRVADQILVMYQGRSVAQMPRQDTNLAKLAAVIVSGAH